MAGSHLVEEIGGEAFLGGAFLVGKGMSASPKIVDFGGLFL